jgi:hypothetical protein
MHMQEKTQKASVQSKMGWSKEKKEFDWTDTEGER